MKGQRVPCCHTWKHAKPAPRPCRLPSAPAVSPGPIPFAFTLAALHPERVTNTRSSCTVKSLKSYSWQVSLQPCHPAPGSLSRHSQHTSCAAAAASAESHTPEQQQPAALDAAVRSAAARIMALSHAVLSACQDRDAAAAAAATTASSTAPQPRSRPSARHSTEAASRSFHAAAMSSWLSDWEQLVVSLDELRGAVARARACAFLLLTYTEAAHHTPEAIHDTDSAVAAETATRGALAACGSSSSSSNSSCSSSSGSDACGLDGASCGGGGGGGGSEALGSPDRADCGQDGASKDCGGGGRGVLSSLAVARAARLLAWASAEEEAVLQSKPVLEALMRGLNTQQLRHQAGPRDDQHEPDEQVVGHSSDIQLGSDAACTTRLCVQLLPGLLREGYHPPGGDAAHAPGLARADKLALLQQLRREQRQVAGQLQQLLLPQRQGPAANARGAAGAAVSQQSRETCGAAAAAGPGAGADDPEEVWAAAMAEDLPYNRTAAAGGGSGGGGMGPGAGGLGQWACFDVGAEELRGDPVLSEVLGRQLGGRVVRLGWEGEEQQRGQQQKEEVLEGLRAAGGVAAGGGRGCSGHQGWEEEGQEQEEQEEGEEEEEQLYPLQLTLDACAQLLQAHPDPMLRQQVYEEGVAPLWSAALELVQRLRDLRAQEATMYGMYGDAEALYGSTYEPDALAALYGTHGLGAGGGGTAGAGGGGGGTAGGRRGYGSLAHLDTLARGAPAAAAFLSALVESLGAAVEEQLDKLRRLAAEDTVAGANGVGTAVLGEAAEVRVNEAGLGLGAGTWTGAGLERALWLQAYGGWDGGDHTGRADSRAMCVDSTTTTSSSSSSSGGGATEQTGTSQAVSYEYDEAAPYMTDLSAVLAGVSDWLQEWMGVRLVPWQPAGEWAGAVGTVEAVDAMIADLRRAHGGWSGYGCVEEEALAALRGAVERKPWRYAVVRVVVEGEEGAGEEGEEEGEAGAGVTGGLDSSSSGGGGGGEGEAGVGLGIRRWLLFDAQGGYGTRYILPPVAPTRGTTASVGQAGAQAAAAAAAATGGIGNSTAPASAPAVVAVAVGLQASLWATNWEARGACPNTPHHQQRHQQQHQQQCGTDAVSTASPTSSLPQPVPSPPSAASSPCPPPDPGPWLTRGSAFALWELLHETGHALHFALGAAPTPPPPPPTHLPDTHPPQLLPPGSHARNHQHRHQHHYNNNGHPQPYHAFLPSCLPLELVELPSSLLERGAADPRVIGTVLGRCRHRRTGAPPPPHVARRLARAVQVSYYSPLSVAGQALLSLHEQLLLLTPRRAPGSAQALWDSLRAALAPHVPGEVTLQQLHALPRLGRAGGQGYAYSAAGYWAGLLWGAAGTSMEKIEAGAGAGTKAGDAEPLWRQGVGGRVGCRGDVGRVVRRLLYERDASRPAAEVVWELFEGVAGVVGAEAVGQAAGAGDGEAGAGKWQLPVLRTEGGGCVPRVGTKGWT